MFFFFAFIHNIIKYKLCTHFDFMEIVWMHDYTTSRCMMLGMSNQCIEFKLHKKVFYTPVCTRMMVIDPLFHSTTF